MPVLPGKFVSTLDVRQDGTFAYAYTGEIHMLALSRLAQMGREGGTFTPHTCFGGNGGTERECTAAEIDEQKREWAESQTHAADRRKRESEQMKGVLANTTDEGPQQTTAGSKREWTVIARSGAAPMALLRIGTAR